jgi:hypothetical protein
MFCVVTKINLDALYGFRGFLYFYYSHFVKFLEPNKHFKLTMDSVFPDSFIGPSQSPVSSSTQHIRIFHLCVSVLEFILPWEGTVELGYNEASRGWAILLDIAVAHNTHEYKT